MKKSSSQIEALRNLLGNKRSYTFDDLIARVGKATGRSVSRGSLNVALSKLRAGGFNVETTRGTRDGTTPTKYRGAVTVAA